MRLRACHGARRVGACPPPRANRLWRLLPCGLPAAQPPSLGLGARLGGRGLSRMRRARHQPHYGQSRRRIPDPLSQERADREDLRFGHLPGAARHFGNRIPETIIEPGRGMVGNAGVIEAEVVLVSKKSENDDVRWVYLDIGKFGGLAETMDESIRYPIRTPRDGA